MTKQDQGDLDLRGLLLRASQGHADPGERRILRAIFRTHSLDLLAGAVLGDDPQEYAPERAPETFLAEIEVEAEGRLVARGNLTDGTAVALTLEDRGDDALVAVDCDQELDLLCLWRAPRPVAPLDAPRTFTFRLAGLVDLPEGNTSGQSTHGWALAAEDEAKKRLDKNLDAQWEQLGDAGCVLTTLDGVPRRLDFELAIRKARSGVVVSETSYLNREKEPAIDRSTKTLIPAERSLVPLEPFPEDVVLSRHMARVVTSLTSPGGGSEPLMRGTFEREVPEVSHDFAYVRATIFNPTPQEALLSADRIAQLLCDRTDDSRQFVMRQKHRLGFGKKSIDPDLVLFVTVDKKEKREQEAVDRAEQLKLFQKMDDETVEDFLMRLEAKIHSGKNHDLLRKDLGADGDAALRAEAKFARAQVKRIDNTTDAVKLKTHRPTRDSAEDAATDKQEDSGGQKKNRRSRINVERVPTDPKEDPSHQAMLRELPGIVESAINQVASDGKMSSALQLVLLGEKIVTEASELMNVSRHTLARRRAEVMKILKRRFGVDE